MVEPMYRQKRTAEQPQSAPYGALLMAGGGLHRSLTRASRPHSFAVKVPKLAREGLRAGGENGSGRFSAAQIKTADLERGSAVGVDLREVSRG